MNKLTLLLVTLSLANVLSAMQKPNFADLQDKQVVKGVKHKDQKNRFEKLQSSLKEKYSSTTATNLEMLFAEVLKDNKQLSYRIGLFLAKTYLQKHQHGKARDISIQALENHHIKLAHSIAKLPGYRY